MLAAKTLAQIEHHENRRGRALCMHDFLGGSNNGFLFFILMKNGKFCSLPEQIELWLMLHNLCNWFPGIVTVLPRFLQISLSSLGSWSYGGWVGGSGSPDYFSFFELQGNYCLNHLFGTWLQPPCIFNSFFCPQKPSFPRQASCLVFLPWSDNCQLSKNRK